MSRAARALALGAALVVARAEARADEPVEVEVRGDLLQSASTDPTIASSVIDDEALSDPGDTIAGELARVPGVTVWRTGGAADISTASLRGATSAETSVYLGPIRLNDAFTGTADLSQYPVGFFRRLSVFRGHAPLRLERPGLGGAIVLEPSLPDRGLARAGAELGSFGEHAVAAMAAVGDEQLAGALSLRLDGSAGDFSYTDDRGTRFDEADDRVIERKNADARSLDVWGAVRLGLGPRGALALFVNGFFREQGAPGLGVVPAARARESTERALVAAIGSVTCAITRRCRIETFSFVRRGTLEIRDPLRELPFAAERVDVSGTSFGAGLAVSQELASEVDLEIGARVTSESLALASAGLPERQASSTWSRFHAEANAKPAPALELRGGAALEAARTDGEGAPERALLPTARAGAAVSPIEALTFYSTIARYVRPPTLAERYGSSPTVLGNPLLQEESGGSLDVGARAKLDADEVLELAADVTGFGRLASGLITYQRSSAGILKPYNLGDARVLGLESAVSVRVLRALAADVSLTWMDARDTSPERSTTRNAIPFLSRLVVTPSLAAELRDVVPEIRWDLARVGVDLLYRSTRTADPAGLVTLPEALDLGASVACGFARGAFTARARLTNLLDRPSTDLLGYPLPGRAFHIGIEAVTP